jgi:hypothetical protein
MSSQKDIVRNLIARLLRYEVPSNALERVDLTSQTGCQHIGKKRLQWMRVIIPVEGTVDAQFPLQFEVEPEFAAHRLDDDGPTDIFPSPAPATVTLIGRPGTVLIVAAEDVRYSEDDLTARLKTILTVHPNPTFH